MNQFLTRHDQLPLEQISALLNAESDSPFAVLGPHQEQGALVVRCLLPGARSVEVIDAQSGVAMGEMTELVPGLFSLRCDNLAVYRLRIHWPEATQETADPYAFGPQLGELDLHLFSEGRHRELGKVFGAQLWRGREAAASDADEEVAGVRFVVWAPNARRVSVVGNFNSWDGRRHPMRRHSPSGVWELFIPGLAAGEIYKYEILGEHGILPLKADPYALRTELPPANASVVSEPLELEWQDDAWLAWRTNIQAEGTPLSIYELHATSWRRPDGDSKAVLNWRELAQELIPYVKELGFSHIELMPIMEHPFGGSWGYQPLSQFAPTARLGSPADFAAFVDACHQAGIGVILDWVPAHFPNDEHGLALFDGTALYEYAHPFEGYHQDWNTCIYNLGRHEVHGFMLSSALHWLQTYHIDGLRVDAVASMLYRDYSRKEGEWIPNRHGGRENLEAIDFLRHLNSVVREKVPGALMIAEESTAWPGVSQPAEEGGLGFTFKWNMGWMHDSLNYVSEDPVNRRYHHNQVTFGLDYAFSEHFILPISHDEVVHGKRALLAKMPGDRWQQFANLRLYLSFMWTHPGKKLLFMGCEFGQWREWDHDQALDWYLLQYADHRAIRDLVCELNRLYREEPALHERDSYPDGFEWLIGDDSDNSVFAWLRHGGQKSPALLVVHNCTPLPREDYRIGVPREGAWEVLLNSDAENFCGSGAGSSGELQSEPTAAHGKAQSLVLSLPPLGTLVLRPGRDA
ncbi:1,4-alpha-glucan branching enzyme [Halopseudomonas sabulinigri]|uniref:1,4-alpha-glucan branching enzyme GlgB n=1 Tax=Halopseudomonas sabulinigri TaxID=472181 RepID=A0A1H1PE38_9GAMM|nr:1,4-alpha-glucan branching enzyme [Halopseudomonas sabulinigri]